MTLKTRKKSELPDSGSLTKFCYSLLEIMPDKQNSTENNDKIQSMFNDIAPKYDRLNHIMTLGLDRHWRKKLVRMISPLQNKIILDIATGTGDLAFSMIKKHPKFIHGIDLSESMVDHCNQKIQCKKSQDIFRCTHADVLNIPFNNHFFDIASISFGIRNFQNPEAALHEIKRLIKPGGTFVVLEFFRSRLVEKNKLFRFYMKKVIPFAGSLISGHPDAYRYLFQSIEHFLSEQEFADLMEECGFKEIQTKKLFFGTAFIIIGKSPENL
jgi:demethylmenaquinone methyltransferase / 2-methoxy-6-polyprenyl-1,4-benzoquinol methylase